MNFNWNWNPPHLKFNKLQCISHNIFNIWNIVRKNTYFVFIKTQISTYKIGYNPLQIHSCIHQTKPTPTRKTWIMYTICVIFAIFYKYPKTALKRESINFCMQFSVFSVGAFFSLLLQLKFKLNSLFVLHYLGFTCDVEP